SHRPLFACSPDVGALGLLSSRPHSRRVPEAARLPNARVLLQGAVITFISRRSSSVPAQPAVGNRREMIDRLGTRGEKPKLADVEKQCNAGPSVNKQQESLLGAAKGDAAVAALSPRRRPKPQINRALPHDRGVSFGTVTLHKAPQK
ncbi:unnamed protein product, partial [Pleuronectes platessa]